MRRLPFILLFAPLLVLNACYYDKEEELYPGACQVGDASQPGYWAGTVQPLIQQRCTSCHAPGGVAVTYGDFTTYAGVKAVVDNGKFQQEVFIQRSMPTTGPLPACDIQKLQAWVNEGASDQ